MLVRAICDHFHETLRREGEEFDHPGPLYKHVVPVEPEQPKKRGKAGKQDGEE